MKSLKSIIVLVLIIVFSGNIVAQKKGTEELKLGYGYATSTQIVYDIADIFSTVFTLGDITNVNETTYGALNIGYNYSVSDKVSLGASITYEQIRNDVKSNKDIIGNNTCSFYTVALEATVHYVRKENFQMYSGLGLAYTYGSLKFDSSNPQEQSSDDVVNLFNFNITGIGVRCGRAFGGFAELGFGYKGLASVGLSYQL